MNNTVLLSTEREKDVGVVVSSDMKVSEQCGIAARKGNLSFTNENNRIANVYFYFVLEINFFELN